MDLFKENLALLNSHDPSLARRVGGIPFPENVTVMSARSGAPVPQIQSVYLHSSYEPVQEAKKEASRFQAKPGFQTVVHGLGFGYHVLQLLRDHSGEMIVIEPLMTLFRAFLSKVDLRPFLPRVKFLIAEPPPKILARREGAPWNIFVHKPSARISREYFQNFNKCADAEKYLKRNPLKALVVNPIYGGSLPTARYCAQALENLGHDVASVQCEKFADSFFAIQQVTQNKANSEVLSGLFMKLMNEAILAKAAEFRPDFVLALAQAPLTKEGIARLKALNIPIVFWFVEDFRALTYWKEIAPAYDYIFTIQRNDFFDELSAQRVQNYYYLPQACNPAVHKPTPLSAEDSRKYSTDLSFMGAAYYNRVRSFPQLLEFDFKIWGTEWDLNSPLGQRVQNNNDRVSAEDCVKIFNRAKINLNLHSSSFHETVNPRGDFVNPRTFEIAACGAFQLVDERSDLHEMFRVGEEIATFKSLDELKVKTRHYLNNPGARASMAAKARDRALREHTFERRMTELLIRVYQDRLGELRQRKDTGARQRGHLIEQAGESAELGRYLRQFEKTKSLSLKNIVKSIEKGEGELTNNELLLLMVDQIVVEEN